MVPKSIAMPLALAALCGCSDHYTVTDEGYVCVYPGECPDGGPASSDLADGGWFEEDQPICVTVELEAEGHRPDDDDIEKGCSVSLDGQQIVVHSVFDYWQADGFEIFPGPEEGFLMSTHCEGPWLAAGEYYVTHGTRVLGNLVVPGEGSQFCQEY